MKKHVEWPECEYFHFGVNYSFKAYSDMQKVIAIDDKSQCIFECTLNMQIRFAF